MSMRAPRKSQRTFGYQLVILHLCLTALRPGEGGPLEAENCENIRLEVFNTLDLWAWELPVSSC
eukprot:7078097-Pyramimonas_sp.AAC.1